MRGRVVDYQKAFDEFDAAGGRKALERQLAELDRVAQASVLEGMEPDSRLMALREGLQRLLAAINDLAASGENADPAAPEQRAPRVESSGDEHTEDA